MSMAVNRGIMMTLLLSLLISCIMAFASPMVASAGGENYHDPNSMKVSIDANGNLKIGGDGFASGGSAGAWIAFINKYKAFITGIAGIGAVTMVVLFIIQFMKLGASAGNPQARSQALVGVLWTGIAAAGLGAVTLIVGFFYNAV